MKFRMVAADPAPVVRTGLRLFFKESNIEMIAEAGSGAEAVQKTIEFRPDLLLTDFLFSDMSGIDILEQLKRSQFEGSIVFYTERDRSFYSVGGIPANLFWFLKSAERDFLVENLEHLLYRKGSCLPEESGFTIHEEGSESLILSDSLTFREKQIILYVARGLGNKEIAAILGLSKNTVKEHISNVLRKLGARDRTQAAVIALKNGIISL
ncbi:MAG: response regulator transcription factor [Planctomycetia bacterium]|nr:response regulator transcription factor [Planctomycetia bacterium]